MINRTIYFLGTFFITSFLLIIISCSQGKGKTLQLIAGGASFPAPLYQKWFKFYEEKTGVKINYQATGSGAGQKHLEALIFQFAGSDAIVSDEKIAGMKEKGYILHHFPTTLASVAIVYNLEAVEGLKLTPEVLADIYLGNIVDWSDAKIAAINPDYAKRLKGPITVVHRSDGSGTTAIFSDYLTKVNKEWKEKVGSGKSLRWPAATSIGGKKNAGVAGLVLNKRGTIGYVSLDYALSSGQPVASLKNKSGHWIKPSANSAKMAGNIDLPVDTRIMLTDTDFPEGYPITGFTWILFMEDLKYRNNTLEQAKALKQLFYWILSEEAQSLATELNYAPLSDQALKSANLIVSRAKFGEEPL